MLICWESYEKAVSITWAVQQTCDSGTYLFSSLRTAWAIHDWVLEKCSCPTFLCLFLYFCFLSHRIFSFGLPLTAALLIEGEVIQHITEHSVSLFQLLTDSYVRSKKKAAKKKPKKKKQKTNNLSFLSVWLTGVFQTPTSIYFFCFWLFLESGHLEMIISWQLSIINHYLCGLDRMFLPNTNTSSRDTYCIKLILLAQNTL